MRFSSTLRLGVWIAAIGLFPVCLRAQAPTSPTPPVNDAKGLPPRAAPGDYQAQAKAGEITIAAEFAGHAVPTPDAVYNSEDYVVVEAALFGPPEARLKLAASDFTLR